MRGRKPVPAAVLERRGSYKKDPQRKKSNPKLGGRPKMPRHLEGDAKTEWKRMVVLLERAGLLDEMDQRALALYCDSHADWLEAKRKVKKHGIAIVEDGQIKRNPYFTAKNQAADRCYKLLCEFGLTPSSRARLEVKSQEDGTDWFEEALRRRGGVG